MRFKSEKEGAHLQHNIWHAVGGMCQLRRAPVHFHLEKAVIYGENDTYSISRADK
jgi:hypothetical protein